MTGPLSGIRVLEVASHVFVPIGGGVLAEWGADVIKIEHPVTGDPYRGLVTAGLHSTHGGIDPSFQFTNRGKKSVTVDLKNPEGRDLIYRLAKECDVFLTNFRPQARKKLQIECEDIRAHNPDVIYVRGSGYGQRGPDVQRGGYDAAAYWARAGFAEALTPQDQEWPIMQRPAFGDVVGGLTIAGAISAALYKRAATGEPSMIDVSLLSMGMWQLQPDITHAKLNKGGKTAAPDRKNTWNPLTGIYRTRDRRYIMLVMLEADRFWANFCEVVGHPELVDDPRFIDMPTRKENSAACVEALDAIFAERDFADWCETLQKLQGVWAPFQSPLEVHSDPQVVANGYLADVEMINGTDMTLVTSPVQFDEKPGVPTRAPEHGEHTEAELMELGLTWDDISTLKDAKAIG